MQITDHYAKANPLSVSMVQPVLLRGQLANQFLSLTGNPGAIRNAAGGTNEARLSLLAPACQPMSIARIGLATRGHADVPGIHHLGADAGSLNAAYGALPVVPGVPSRLHLDSAAAHWANQRSRGRQTAVAQCARRHWVAESMHKR